MTGNLTTGAIPGAVISANAYGPWRVSVNGRPARLAIVTDDGQVVAAGDDVAAELRAVALNAVAKFWQGQGHMTVTNEPQPTTPEAAPCR